MLKRLMVAGALALALAAPAQAEGGKQLRVRGVVVSASAEMVAVENTVGDATLKCLVPERLAEEAAALKPGDKVRMLCKRKHGERAVLHKLELLGDDGGKAEKREKGDKPERHEKAAKPEKPEHHDKPAKPEKPDHHKKPAKPEEKGEKRASATARGLVVELGAAAIVVEDAATGRRLACKVPASKAHKLEGVKLGDRVEIHCANDELAYLKRPEALESKLYGTISALSSTSVSVTGDGRSLTCSAPAAFAEKLARFAVGDRVKMMCRGTELTYLEKV